MIIRTIEGIRIKTREDERPEWSNYHKRFYVAGYRWVKTKQAWSSNCLLHNFVSFDVELPATVEG